MSVTTVPMSNEERWENNAKALVEQLQSGRYTLTEIHKRVVDLQSNAYDDGKEDERDASDSVDDD